MTKKEPEEKRKKRERKGAKASAEGLAPGQSVDAENQGASPSAGAAEDEAPAPPADEPSPSTSAITPRRRGFLLLGAVAGIALVGWGIYELLGVDTESTDDAYVAGNIVPITAREAGTVIAIRADNTQGVKAGDTLVELDPALVNVQMDAAEAALARAVRQAHAEGARLNASAGEVAEAEAALATARGDLTRRKAAAASGAVPAEDLAHASDALRHAEAALALAQGHRAEALAAVSGTDVAHNPAVLTAIAEIHRAAIAQGHMRITAPVDGVVAQRNVQIGEQIAGGTPLMAVVPLRDVWVEANFRETPSPLVTACAARRNWPICASASRSPSRPMPGAARGAVESPSTATSPGSARAAAPPLPCCRRKTPAATGSRWCSACRCASRSTPASWTPTPCASACR